MRILIAGLLGGIAFFFWGAVSHMALDLGDKGFHYGSSYQSTLGALEQEGGEAGIYILPSVGKEQMQDEAAIALLAKETAGAGYAFVVYQPGGNPGMSDMGPNLAKQFGTDLASAFIIAWILGLGAFGFGKRVLIAAALGLLCWLVICVPQWNWYLFPLDYTLGLLAKYVIGWGLAGAAMAAWLGRKGL